MIVAADGSMVTDEPVNTDKGDGEAPDPGE